MTTEPPQPPPDEPPAQPPDAGPPAQPPSGQPPVPQPGGIPANLADWGTRAVGLLIDYLPIAIFNLLFFRGFLLGSLGGIVSLLYWLYMGHLDGVTGQTPGKAMMGTRVVNTHGELIGSGSGMVRKIAHIVDSLICGLGWLLPIVDSQRQTIADKIMTTYVVIGIEKKAFAVDLWMPPKQ